ncbi:unnamed protein product [Echinostoma caproni]|uniref:PDZ domain-containing protein n=1 Tax=Echinostoma caproni TaxID=27848 RepID=A0A183AQF4_9TREM|nr:unnamed protein product [Echinostoma caproni]
MSMVVIALFWLAKAVEQHPDCKTVPRLDYSAFVGLLPKPVIYHTPVGVTGDSEIIRSKNSNSLERKSSYVGEQALTPHYFVRPQASNTMGNAHTQSVTSIKKGVPLTERAQTLPAQTNNSALDEDEWQADLDDWREKRRKAARLQATKMFSLEEQKQEEERKHQAAIRARMQEIKFLHRNQRTSVTSSYIPSTDIIQPPPVSSPGMALLTGAAFDLSEINDDSVLSAIAPYGTFNRTNKSNTLGCDWTAPLTNGHSVEPEVKSEAEITSGPDTEHTLNEAISDIDEPIEPKSSSVDACQPVSNSDNLSDPLTAQEFRSIVIRLQPKSGAFEPRWGLTFACLYSDYPDCTTGSSADVCDVLKGDILIELNGRDLRKSSNNESFTLHDLEQMMDQLLLSGKTTTVTVLRKVDHQDEFTESESIGPSDVVERAALNQASGDSEAVATSLSDLDETVLPVTVTTINKVPVNSTGRFTPNTNTSVDPLQPLAVQSVQVGDSSKFCLFLQYSVKVTQNNLNVFPHMRIFMNYWLSTYKIQTMGKDAAYQIP